MSYSADDLTAIAKKIRYDLTAAQGKLTDLMNGIAEFSSKLPADGHGYRCPNCGLDFSTAVRLAEHRENVHGVRVPDSCPEPTAPPPKPEDSASSMRRAVR